MSIKTLLQNTPLPPIEAEILLAKVLTKNRTFLHTWPDKEIAIQQKNDFKKLISRRLQGEPIAYIIGEKEFWSLNFKVTEDVLIPRPETELLIETILKYCPQPHQRVLDLGTGCGNIAISLAYECPTWTITAIDQSEKALRVAIENAKHLNIPTIHFYHLDWEHFFELHNTSRFNIIVSNPPYLAKTDPHLSKGDCRFEPTTALTDFEDGLSAYHQIIPKAKLWLETSGWLFLEHGYHQGSSIRTMMHENGFREIKTFLDLSQHERITICQK